jgi:hypothetical protein
MKQAIALLVLLSSVPAWGGSIGPVNSADVTLWSYPSPPQDMNNLPSSPDGVSLDASSFHQDGSAPIDVTFSGTAPQGGNYSMHVLADASAAGVHAAFQTSYDSYRGSNLFGPLYLNGDQVFQGSKPDIGYVNSTMYDSLNVAGPGAGNYSATLVVHFDGSNSSPWAYASIGAPEPSPYGAVIADSFPNGEAVEFRQDGSYDQILSSTSSHPIGESAFFAYGFGFAQYSPSWLDLEQAQNTLLSGTMDFNFSSTATVEKVLITLPAGSDPHQYSATFGSGANYNVEFVVGGAVVPEPTSALLFLLAAATCVGARLRKFNRTNEVPCQLGGR